MRQQFRYLYILSLEQEVIQHIWEECFQLGFGMAEYNLGA